MGMYEFIVGIAVLLFIAWPWILLTKTTADITDISKDIYYNGTNTTLPDGYLQEFDVPNYVIYFFMFFLILLVFASIVKKSGEDGPA